MTIVVCTLPRSGSWLLCDALWRTGVAGRPQEYLRPDWYERFQQVGRVEFENRLHGREPWNQPDPDVELRVPGSGRGTRQFIDNVIDIATTDNGVCALKCHWFQAEPVMRRLGRPGHPVALHEAFPRTRYVRLRRQDKTRQAISWFRAIQSNHWWARGTPARQQVLEYDADRIAALRDDLVQFEAAWDRYFEECPEPPVTVTYEDLSVDYEQTMRGLLGELDLGSPAGVPPPRLAQQADDLTSSWVARLAERPHHPGAGTEPRQRSTPTSTKEETMRTSLIVVDNFYANPEAVRQYALKQEYYLPYQSEAEVSTGDRRATWMTSRFLPADICPFKSSKELIARLETITGDRIDMEHWSRDFPLTARGKPVRDHRRHGRSCLWNCSFHVKPETGQQLGEGVHNHVTDTWNGVGESGWTGLIYLSDNAPLRGGLKLWRNVDQAHNYDWMTPKEKWELIDDLGNVPNRLLLCRGSVPHSGARGWGRTVEDSRLYQTFFFRVRPVPPVEGILAPV